jgi:hypothetical protein
MYRHYHHALHQSKISNAGDHVWVGERVRGARLYHVWVGEWVRGARLYQSRSELARECCCCQSYNDHFGVTA